MIHPDDAVAPPTVSALIKTRDRPDMFTEALGSALGQTIDDLEVVVVEEGGPRYAHRVAAAVGDPRVRVLRNEVPRGATGASRQLAEAARGRYVAFLDDDDLWDPTMLEILCGHLDSHPGAAVAFCRRRFVDDAGRELSLDHPLVHTAWGRPPSCRGIVRPFIREAVAETVVHAAQCVVVRRDAVDWSQLDESLGATWDRWIVWLASRDGAAAYYEPEVLASYRMHTGMATHNRRLSVLSEQIEVNRRIATDPRVGRWGRQVRRELVRLLLARALAMADDDLAAARRDVRESLSVLVTWRALRTLPVLHLPAPAARRIRDGYRRVKSAVSEARSATTRTERGPLSP